MANSLKVNPADGNAWWVYLLRCADGTLYCGVTCDLQRRVRQHNGELIGGARFTGARRPVALAWCERAVDRGAAQRREAQIKRMNRGAKEQLIAD